MSGPGQSSRAKESESAPSTSTLTSTDSAGGGVAIGSINSSFVRRLQEGHPSANQRANLHGSSIHAGRREMGSLSQRGGDTMSGLEQAEGVTFFNMFTDDFDDSDLD